MDEEVFFITDEIREKTYAIRVEQGAYGVRLCIHGQNTDEVYLDIFDGQARLLLYHIENGEPAEDCHTCIELGELK